MPNRVRRIGGLIASAGACAAALAACGASANRPGRSPSAHASSGVRFAQCVRSHGYPKFPDPGGSFPPGIKQSPAFQSAWKKCLRLEPEGTSTGKPLDASQRAAVLAQVRCIREHGVSDFPDPSFPASGGEPFPAIPGFSPTSPVFKRAAAACGLKGSLGQPHGG